ncbi:MAG: Phytoene desaturase (lycopene-forming) [Gammaproteobacteria bacterium]|nr:Phytoene desaturase (lycopene-forming) [Gammaproteobacteria bacterium]
MNSDRDVIVIGAGHNGLACAAYLARAGRKVLVVEAAAAVGGAAATAEFAPGYSVSACAHLCHQLNPRVIEELALVRHGLRWAATGLDTIALSATGRHLRIAAGGASVSGAGVSAGDTAALADFDARMKRFARLLVPLLDQRPPRLADSDWRDKLALARLGWSLRRMGRTDMQEFLRIAAINIHDVLEETFEHPLLKGAIGLDAVLGTHMGPRSPNTVLSYLYRLSGACTSRAVGIALPRGGMAAVSGALAGAAQAHGAEIRTGTRVARILVEHDRISGVELAGGEILRAGTVVSNADPRTTFFGLLGAGRLEAGFARYVKNIRMRGTAAKLHLALDRLPAFNGLEPASMGNRLLIAPTLSYVERAFDHAKYREYSPAPVMEIVIPTLNDSSLAPPGKHVLSAIVQYAPYDLRSGWEQAGEQYRDRLIDTLAQHAPDIRDCIIAAQVLTPVDIERRFGMTGGHWHHGELALDQFLMLRPAPGAAQYATPLPGLYLCGAGAHPGGGVMGSVGRNAAGAILSGAA